MQLTQRQELLIAHYVRAVGRALEPRLSGAQKERALSRLDERIRTHLKTNGAVHARDEDVKTLLDTLGAPEQQAAILARIWGRPEEGAAALSIADIEAREKIEAAQQRRVGGGDAAAAPGARRESSASPRSVTVEPPEFKTNVSRVWLGVLGYLASRWKFPAWMLRTLVFILGCITAPAALLVYTAAYLVLHLSGRFAAGRLRPWAILWRPVSITAGAGIIYAVGHYGLHGIQLAHEAYLNRPLPDLQEWAWLETEAVRMLTVTLALFLPVALLSAMPLSAAWDRTLKRLSQAGVALYAIVVSFGIASFITGLILAFVREFTA